MEDWKQLAAEEKDPERVRLLIEKLIEALSEEQQRVQDDIEGRLAYSAKAAERKI